MNGNACSGTACMHTFDIWNCQSVCHTCTWHLVRRKTACAFKVYLHCFVCQTLWLDLTKLIIAIKNGKFLHFFIFPTCFWYLKTICLALCNFIEFMCIFWTAKRTLIYFFTLFQLCGTCHCSTLFLIQSIFKDDFH